MQRNDQDQTSVVWQTVGLRLGTRGLDLRETFEPGNIVKLRNARFLDERTIVRRDGHRGVRIQDQSDFPPSGTISPTGWCYGHGQVNDTANAQAQETDHLPIPKQGRGIFHFDEADVAWTGDRLFIMRDDGLPAVGRSSFWTGAETGYGVPAYLPVMDDSPGPNSLTGDYIETALTSTLRVYVETTSTQDVVATIVDRTTGAVLDKSIIVTGVTPRDVRVVNSNEIPVVVYRDQDALKIAHWTGVAWTVPTDIAGSDCDMHDVHAVPGGFYILWRDTVNGLKVGKYTGTVEQSYPVTFGTVLKGAVTAGAASVAVAPDASIGLVWQTTGYVLSASVFDSAGANEVTLELAPLGGGVTGTPWNSGVTACFRKLGDHIFGVRVNPEDGQPPIAYDIHSYPLIIHAALGDTYTKIYDVRGYPGNDIVKQAEETRYNTRVYSKSFRVGNEVFCWLRATNSSTGYLVAGVTMPQVSGICDREDAHARVVTEDTLALPRVAADPLNEYAFTWVRPYQVSVARLADATFGDGMNQPGTTGRSYARQANTRMGDMDFMPKLSAVQYGRSVYLAGSHVRNYDGQTLGDAGFHDYPKLNDSPQYTASNGAGSLTPASQYYYRVYAVRYNAQGERFMSAALTSSVMTTGGIHDTIAFNIYTLPVTNHDDVFFEVYRTEAGGTTFYLDGCIANDLSAQKVTYTSLVSDEVLRTRQGDSHAPGIGIPAELEEFGPVGCRILAVSGDRLWGAGGQVPRGWVQFSKLKEQLEGAGFDALAGMQEVDTQGGAITSIIGYSDGVIIFEMDRIYILGGGGPDNYGSGSFPIPQLVLAGGASTHLGTAVTQNGVVFWGSDGPRLMDLSFRVRDIHLPIRSLTSTLTPSGVTVDLARQECVWYTESGTAILWCYADVETRFGELTSIGRFAEWTGLNIAGATLEALITTDGRVFYQDPDAAGDDGVPYAFCGAIGETNPENVLGGFSLVRAIGVIGEYQGPHNLRLRVYFDGQPAWTDEYTWNPRATSWLVTVGDYDTLTPAQFDALDLTDHTGGYAMHRRTSRQACRTFRVEWSDVSAFGPTYAPHELTLELGARGGPGRVPLATMTTKIGR